ncbi:mechanosensitive ion channel domain-containing protein [Sodalinema gerasimenkoae]|uniref:mechanosensitive ion channel domain-containing protein n=1 Tax=Sodalinema gerasimenkoae TaxID=2862348 RepID=UPI001356F47C|nr:mechanosensitive ion channel domain-containing protein [Sodalinema gerasimenkoae]
MIKQRLVVLEVASFGVTLLSQSLVLAQSEEPEEFSEKILTEITLGKVLYGIFAILIAYGSFYIIQSLANWISERVPRRFRLIIKQSIPFWKGLILLITIAYLLNLFVRLSETNVVAVTGTVAVALGFAFKDYVSSIIAGAIALFEAPYRVGDRVRIEDHYGEVVGYGLRGIQVKTPDDNLVTIPHNKTWTEPISNANSGELEAQVATNFYFSHTVDFEKVIKILYQAAYSSRYTQLKLPIAVFMEEKFWGTQFKLRSYPIDARDEFVYKTDVIRRAKAAFAYENISYPKMTPPAEMMDEH